MKKWYNKYNYYEISNKYNVYITYNKGCSQINIATVYFKDDKYKDTLIERLGKTLYNRIVREVKQLKRKYNDYDIKIFGKPLDEPTNPFTNLPKTKKLDDCEVVEIKVTEQPYTEYEISFKTLQRCNPIEKKGFVKAYVK